MSDPSNIQVNGLLLMPIGFVIVIISSIEMIYDYTLVGRIIGLIIAISGLVVFFVGDKIQNLISKEK